MNNYVDYILEQAKNLLAIDSPSGYTAEVTAYLLEEYKRLGYKARLTGKGGVLADLGGEGEEIIYGIPAPLYTGSPRVFFFPDLNQCQKCL